MAAEETAWDFLDRRESELTNRRAAIKGQLEAIEAELDGIQRARAALGPGNVSLSASTTFRAVGIATARAVVTDGRFPSVLGSAEEPHGAEVMSALQMSAMYQRATIKDLIILGLRDNPDFRQRGATPNELRIFIASAYGREVDRASLSPQLSRLREEGVLEPSGDGRWNRVVADTPPFNRLLGPGDR